jgi:hypothetical protein
MGTDHVAGDLVGELDDVLARYRDRPDDDLLQSLVDLRHRAALELASAAREPWPPAYPDLFPGTTGVPEVAAADLTTEVMGSAIAHHGCLLVRGLFDDAKVARTTESLNRARDVWRSGPVNWTAPHYLPAIGLDLDTEVLRKRIRDLGGIWLADSASATQQVLDDLAAVGVLGMIAEHFGERPVFSLQKSTLRRVSPHYRFTAYHQDGSFLGPETRALNVWITFTACGGDRPVPGLELVPARVEQILDTDPRLGRAAIDGWVVHEVAAEAGKVVPTFDPGDGLLFDEHLVHRTHVTEDMLEPRLALECWFFAPSHPNDEYLPLLV